MPVSRVGLSPNGLEVSRIVYGVWRHMGPAVQGDLTIIRELLALCLDHGVTSFDHADIYGNYQCEEVFGRALTPNLRTQVQLISKCGIKLLSPQRPEHRRKSYDTGAQHIIRSVEVSLKNLRTDYLDLLLIHRPDPLMNADEISETIENLIQSGKIRAFGVSNFSRHHFDLLQSRCSFPLATNQIEAHPLHLQPFLDGTLDHAQQHRYRPMIWSPLASGRIWTENLNQNLNLQKTLLALAEQKQTQPETLLLAWLLMHPAGLIPVLGSTTQHRLAQLFKAESVHLSREEWFEIFEAGLGTEIP